nr:winged helix-turn-helix transcriptional regulator [Rhizobium sp. SG570]
MTKTVESDDVCWHFCGSDLPVRPRGFAALAQQLIDVWISRDEVDHPSGLSRVVGEQLAANMVLAVITVPAGGAIEFDVHVVRDYSIPTTYADVPDVLKSRLPMLPGGRLHPSIQKALAVRRPSLVSETVRHDSVQTDFEMLSLPRKAAKPGDDWCFVYGVVNHILRSSAIPKDLDDVDLAILQLLREGLQMREIGHRIELSPRTIEHRIERLKTLAGARTLHGLVARSL